MNRIRKGDQVVVISGKDKGKRGDVVRVAGDKVVVSNVNSVKRHTKPNPQANQPGGVIEREAPIHVSNVMLFNPATGKASASVPRCSRMDADCACSARVVKPSEAEPETRGRLK